ncbi:hypothetical protein K170097C1_13630 [Hungatella effluvii]
MSKKKNKQQRQALKAPAPAVRRPDFNEVAVAQIQDKYSSYPSNGLTPERLANIFKEADAGDIMRQAELFEEMSAQRRGTSRSTRRASRR